ncbi:T9SS type A sorting domain-containing protein [Patiriisocius sp. Uisw_017]|uniref:T9SS type A sorting domain-containing protein n=1 Tax=Patiriisocius sp. Uisw_017 TaxID=3230968 RepID=UPI0039E95282
MFYYDLQGKLLITQDGTTMSQSINSAKLQTGVYFLEIIGHSNTLTKRIIKE